MNSNRNLLIVEDTAAPREYLTEVAQEDGWAVTTCEDGNKAWEIIQQQTFSLVILDWNLPGLTGVELCRRLRKLPAYTSSVILIITGQHQEGRLEEALEAGVDDYLPKPIPLNLLRIRLSIAESKLREKVLRCKAEQALFEANQTLEHRIDRRTRELTQSQSIYKSIMDNLNIGILLLDTTMTTIQCNPHLLEKFCPTGNAIGQHYHAALNLGDMTAVCPAKKSLADGKMHEAIVNMKLRDAPRDLRIISCPIKNEHDRVLQTILLVEDVTEKVREENHLRNRLEQAERLAEERRQDHLENIVGSSPVMNKIYTEVSSLAASRQTVLLQGETGTGKEVTARALHTLSPWKGEPFIAVNCGSLPESILESELFGHTKGAFTGATTDKAGLFAAAENGTIFLDEIEAASLRTQVSLLRVLDHHEILPVGGRTPTPMKARIVVATNQNLETLILDGCFREDLYFRICGESIELPPLRERTEDLPLLATHFLEEAAKNGDAKSLSPRTLAALARYAWPGNVREFRNLMHSLARTAPKLTIRPADLPESFRRSEAQELPTLAGQERLLVQKSLTASQGNKADAARILGVSRNTVYSLIRKHGLAL